MSNHNKAILLPNSMRHLVFVLIKLSIVIGASYYIYSKLVHNSTLDIDHFITILQENNVFKLKNILVLIGLSCLNWLLESIKWKVLVTNITSISLFNAIEQSLGSLTASLFTPNRIGEYGAKAIYFAKPYRKKVLGLTLAGNLSQLLATVFFGLIGLITFIIRINIKNNELGNKY